MFDAGEISKSDLAALRVQLSASALARLDALVKVAAGSSGNWKTPLQSPLGLPDTLWLTSPRSRRAPHYKDHP